MFKKASFTTSVYSGTREANFHKLSDREVSLCSSAIFAHCSVTCSTLSHRSIKQKIIIDELKTKSQHLEKKKKKIVNVQRCFAKKKASCFGYGTVDSFSQLFSIVRSFLDTITNALPFVTLPLSV